jgi:DNA primase
MAIVEEDIERVRTTLSIAEVIQPYVALRRVGRNWVGLCPFHAEKTGSFNVRDETGRYRCFGCGKAGDMFTFVQEIEHVDFVASVERLAAKAGVQLRYTTGGEGKDRQRRARLIEAMDRAVDWYHQRLLTSPDARDARDYLRGRGLSGDVARRFRLGWAPDDWDALSGGLGVSADVLKDTGLAFVNRRNKLQDSFRARVLFPIFNADGDAVALGGRVLPGSSDPAKYKNSPETAIYAKSKTFYGLNWAKGDIVAANQVIVCEGYTDVIGFHRAGLGRAVATCGTALTEVHVRLLKRYASRVVLAFDADQAGQGAAERFYEWERKYQVEVSVARFPAGQDPGDLASSNPQLLRDAIDGAPTFLGFRLRRVLASRRPDSPEQRSRLANEAMAVVNEHPDENVRKLYAGEVATHTGLPVADLVRVAVERRGRVAVEEMSPRRAVSENAEFGAVALLLQRWDDIAPWLVEPLFADEVVRRAFVALAAAGGHLGNALDLADPEAREVLERAAVADLDLDPEIEARNLIRAAVRRELTRRTRVEDPVLIREDIEARHWVDGLDAPQPDPDLAERLLQWLDRRNEERG